MVVFSGDFRQILSVITRGSQENIVHTIINSLYFWEFVSDGLLGDSLDGELDIEISMDMIVLDFEQTFDELIDFDRTLLTPTLDVVDKIISQLLSIVLGDEKVYLSLDNFCVKKDNIKSHMKFFLSRSIKCS
ncbi:hypothetical protein Ahy_A02g005550 [Arachis hypogaea]|uniref:ATP-dependent DNA helicase n=1 Tax=Arachis hypogaea TaxID=3818 RepID=A0A445E7I1_ARAHY|nr:hypothetical protein Ahy_A02g005550 [Arachis hypogaea]